MMATVFFQEQGVTYFTVYTATTNESATEFYRRQDLAPLYVTLLGEIATIR